MTSRSSVPGSSGKGAAGGVWYQQSTEGTLPAGGGGRQKKCHFVPMKLAPAKMARPGEEDRAVLTGSIRKPSTEPEVHLPGQKLHSPLDPASVAGLECPGLLRVDGQQTGDFAFCHNRHENP